MPNELSGGRATRRPVHVLILGLLTCLLALVTTAAHAGWSKPPATLGGGVNVSRVPITLIDGHRTTYAVWQGADATTSQPTLEVRTRPAGGAWDATTSLPVQPDTTLDDASVSKDGTFTVLSDYQVNPGTPYAPTYSAAATRSPGGTWTSHDFTDYVSRLAVNDRGDVVAYAGVRMSFRPAGGGWGPVETLPVSGGTVGGVQAGLDRHGTATFTAVKEGWCYPDLPCHVVTVERRRDGQWTKPTRTPAQYNADPDGGFWFAESATGEATLAWSIGGTVRTAIRPAGSTAWGPGHTFGMSANGVVPTAMGPAGYSSLVWLGTDHRVHLADHQPGGHWRQRTLGTWTTPPYRNHPDFPSLAAAPDGTVVAGWRGSGQEQMAVRTPIGGWGTPIDVPLGELAVGNGGDITSTWVRRPDGEPYVGTARASAYNPGRAAFGRLKVPVSGDARHRLSFEATSASWLPAKIAWRFGDAHHATGTRVHHRYSAPGRYRVRVTIKDTSGSTRTVTRHLTVR